MKCTVIVGGETVNLEIDLSTPGKIRAQAGGRRYVLDTTSVEPGVYWFNWNNRSIELSVTPAGEAYEVSVGNQKLSVEVVDSRTALRRASHQGHDGLVELRAPMPGKIVKVLLKEGAPVNANQGILIMEAMKMQNDQITQERSVEPARSEGKCSSQCGGIACGCRMSRRHRISHGLHGFNGWERKAQSDLRLIR